MWAAGSSEQRRSTAELLCSGGRVGIVHHELAHGSSVLRGEVTAARTPGGFRLDGRKDLVLDAALESWLGTP
ncbi:hypothetical protein [Streptomyces sp. NPDC003480]